MDAEAKDIIKYIHDRTYRLLTENKEDFLKVAALLLEKEVIFASDVESILGPKVKPESSNKTSELESIADA